MNWGVRLRAFYLGEGRIGFIRCREPCRDSPPLKATIPYRKHISYLEQRWWLSRFEGPISFHPCDGALENYVSEDDTDEDDV